MSTLSEFEFGDVDLGDVSAYDHLAQSRINGGPSAPTRDRCAISTVRLNQRYVGTCGASSVAFSD
jgi:hypothetical protein